MFRLASAAAIVLIYVCSCRGEDNIQVKDIPIPQYPPLARMALVQGTVKVDIEIGADGKVTSATGAGADAILSRAAEKNARLWTFDVPTEASATRMKRSIGFTYKIVGKRARHPGCPSVIVHLPDRIDILAEPPLLNTAP